MTAPGDRPFAHFSGMLATGLSEIADLRKPGALDGGGWWAVSGTFEGVLTGYRFENVRRAALPAPAGSWTPIPTRSWESSLARDRYEQGVTEIRSRIAAGEVYQVNLCRLLTAPLPLSANPLALAGRLVAGNPAPYAGVLHTGADWVVTASPELFLRRSGGLLTTAPVKGTAAPGEPFAAKDFPENIMITDLMRNDLGRIALAGSVRVVGLTEREEHPGLAHLVSTVQARLREGVGWAEILAATHPPGSVSGAPKYTALQIISELEPVPRGPYCGVIGYVDADRAQAVLAVGIRTFFSAGASGGGSLNFGTGAGITYASDPAAEWAETQLKAARLVGLAGAPNS